MLCNEKPLQREAQALQRESKPAHCNWRKPPAAMKTQSSQIKKKKKKEFQKIEKWSFPWLGSLDWELCPDGVVHLEEVEPSFPA